MVEWKRSNPSMYTFGTLIQEMEIPLPRKGIRIISMYVKMYRTINLSTYTMYAFYMYYVLWRKNDNTLRWIFQRTSQNTVTDNFDKWCRKISNCDKCWFFGKLCPTGIPTLNKPHTCNGNVFLCRINCTDNNNLC